MRLDHIAYRAKDRKRTADFFERAFGYHYDLYSALRRKGQREMVGALCAGEG